MSEKSLTITISKKEYAVIKDINGNVICKIKVAHGNKANQTRINFEARIEEVIIHREKVPKYVPPGGWACCKQCQVEIENVRKRLEGDGVFCSINCSDLFYGRK